MFFNLAIKLVVSKFVAVYVHGILHTPNQHISIFQVFVKRLDGIKMHACARILQPREFLCNLLSTLTFHFCRGNQLHSHALFTITQNESSSLHSVPWRPDTHGVKVMRVAFAFTFAFTFALATRCFLWQQSTLPSSLPACGASSGLEWCLGSPSPWLGQHHPLIW